MTRFLDLPTAISELVPDGSVVAMEGFTHLTPMAAGHEIIRQGIRDLTALRMTPDLIYDRMIGAGCIRRLIFSWGGNPGVGSLHRFRDAYENGWPHPIEFVEHSHAGMANAYAAGAAGLPVALFDGYRGTDLPAHNPDIRFITDPFTGRELTVIPAHRPEIGIIHAQRSDRAGNVLIEGIVGVQKEVALASETVVITVEEVVDDLVVPSPNSVVLPHWTVDVVVEAPGGAAPSYAHGYYARDNAAYLEWDAISGDRERFTEWIDENIRRTAQ